MKGHYHTAQLCTYAPIMAVSRWLQVPDRLGQYTRQEEQTEDRRLLQSTAPTSASYVYGRHCTHASPTQVQSRGYASLCIVALCPRYQTYTVGRGRETDKESV